MNYDNWKQKTPDENDHAKKCGHCDVPCNGTYCSNDCKKADLL